MINKSFEFDLNLVNKYVHFIRIYYKLLKTIWEIAIITLLVKRKTFTLEMLSKRRTMAKNLLQ